MYVLPACDSGKGPRRSTTTISIGEPAFTFVRGALADDVGLLREAQVAQLPHQAFLHPGNGLVHS